MDSILQQICLFTPISFIMLSIVFYFLGIGTIKIPGIARGEKASEKEWTTVNALIYTIFDIFSGCIALIGSLFGLIGFFSPWVSIFVYGGYDYYDFNNFNGPVNGSAFLLKSIVAGIDLLNGSPDVGIPILLGALFVFLIPLGFILLFAFSFGIISVPLGFLKGNTEKLKRNLATYAIFTFCIVSIFFIGILSLSNGLNFEVASGIYNVEAQFEHGFGISGRGLLLVIVGVISNKMFMPSFDRWVDRLTALSSSVAKSENDDEMAAND
jgi:hypothetical protein